MTDFYPDDELDWVEIQADESAGTPEQVVTLHPEDAIELFEGQEG